MPVKIIVLSAAAALVLAAPAGAVGVLSKDQAFKRARVCLVKHGASAVIRTPDGGGLATYHGVGSASWSYKTLLGQVSSAKVFYAGRPGLSASRKHTVEVCLTDGI